MMENNPSASSILEKVEKVIRKTEKTLATDEIICACYLYKFLEYGNSKAYDRFKYIFCNLTDEGKTKAIKYYLAYSKSDSKGYQLKKK